MTPAFIDIETQSAADLPAVGGAAYAADASTRVLSLVVHCNGVTHIWVPAAPLPAAPTLWPAGWPEEPRALYRGRELPDAIRRLAADPAVAFVAHNADAFDALIWRDVVKGPPVRWVDTIHDARAAGYPPALDDLALATLGRGKDTDGAAYMKSVTRLDADGRTPHEQPGIVAAVARYNVADVLLLRDVYPHIAGAAEPDIVAVDRAVNARGVRFDESLAARICAVSADMVADATAEIERRTAGELTAADIRSVPKMRRWLESRGVRLANLRRETVDQFLADPDAAVGDTDDAAPPWEVSADVLEVLRLRQSALRITGAKLSRAIASSAGRERLYGLHVYYGAHTGRWASRGVQTHNLPRGAKGVDVPALTAPGGLTLESVRAEAQRINASADDVLSTLIRPCFIPSAGARFTVVDFASIECRGLAWAADEVGLLRAFRDDGDPYLLTASRIFGRPCTRADVAERQIGKVVTLGCGYGMSAPRLADYCALAGVDLSAAGVTAADCVEGYRDAYAAIAGQRAGGRDGRVFRRGGLWHRYEAALTTAVAGGVARDGRCEFRREGRAVTVRLPSGRRLFYRLARVEDRVPVYSTDGRARPTLIYESPRGERTLYGGKIAENVIQAICRDLLAAALARLEAAGVTVVMHIHDEIVAESADPRRVADIVAAAPAWAAGLPVAVEGYACPRYVKSAWPGYASVTARG